MKTMELVYKSMNKEKRTIPWVVLSRWDDADRTIQDIIRLEKRRSKSRAKNKRANAARKKNRH